MNIIRVVFIILINFDVITDNLHMLQDIRIILSMPSINYSTDFWNGIIKPTKYTEMEQTLSNNCLENIYSKVRTKVFFPDANHVNQIHRMHKKDP